MGTQDSVAVVKAGFAAFGRGDLPGLLALMADDVEWVSPGTGLPLAGTYRGRDGVADFFQKLSAETEILAFEPREFIGEGDRVIVVGWERVKVKPTDRTIELDWIMSFTVRDGKVAKYQQYTDTKALADAFGLAARAAV
jgi:ketosteroid isomerase-like protein